ncbi:MAG: hypothetical protein LBN09_09175 [Clostridioides sp.]|jgi:hypothetical protein|nr:hypothetical protein [Clostridioides sp.]
MKEKIIKNEGEIKMIILRLVSSDNWVESTELLNKINKKTRETKATLDN